MYYMASTFFRRYIMNIKLTALTAGIIAAISATANAQPTPPAPPAQYGPGPQAPLLNTTNLSASERTAFALYEGVFKVTEAKVHATSCAAATFDIQVYADGSLGSNTPQNGPNSIYNQVKVTGSGGSGAPQFTLNADVKAAQVGKGQHIQVSLANPGFLGTTKVTQFNALYAFNNVNNMLVTNNLTIGVVGINGGIPDVYTGNLIKDFYHGATDPNLPEYYNIYDWGLQSISKLGYPVNKWWQRSKTHRDDGVQGRTVWVKDRLVGASSCRIVIDTNGYNNQNIFWQGGSIGNGTLTIAPVPPNTPIPAWTEFPF
jgi:hypothetical protein